MRECVRVLLFCIGMILILAVCSQTENNFYVSLEGNDNWSGLLDTPNAGKTDGPFATLQRARKAVRAHIKKSMGAKAVTVSLRGGTYRIEKTFSLNEEDSGTKNAPVTWRAYPDEKVILTGGMAVSGFEPVTDPAMLQRFQPQYRDKIVQVNLRDLGIHDYGSIDPTLGRKDVIHQYDSTDPLVKRRMEVFFKKKFMTLVRYPNEGWLHIEEVPQTGIDMIYPGLARDKSPVPRGRHYGRFRYSGNRPERWSEARDIWMHGYWVVDHRDEYLPVERIDTAAHTIYPKRHHAWGYRKGQRFYFLNIPEELDTPGEWYLDAESGILYFLPPVTPIQDGDVTVSLLEEPLLTLNGTKYVTIENITFECSRGSAITLTNSSHTVIAGCVFRNLGQMAVIIDGGTKNGVRSCDIYDAASGGILLRGGDFISLQPAGHYAVNNHIHDFGIRKKTYTPGIWMTGVGNLAAHNLIHDGPHNGIYLQADRIGNDNIVEYNELYNLAKETGDVGAIYMNARNFTYRGNIVRFNYLHHLFGPGQHGVMGVYVDDFTSGTTVFGNVFYKAGRAAFIGGGRNNTVENNLFIECDPSVHLDARGLGWAQGSFRNINRWIKQLQEVHYTEPPYSERYPELLTVLDDDPAVPKYNKFIRNVSYGGIWFDLRFYQDFSIAEMTENVIADSVLCTWTRLPGGKADVYNYGDPEMTEMMKEKGNTLLENNPGYRDIEKEDFELLPGSPAFKYGFKPIPFEKIGLYVDNNRRSLPER